MKTIKVTSRLTNEEKETIITYDHIDKVWRMESTIAKHFNKALRQEWTPITQYVYDDGVVCGMVLEAPAHAITIRNPNKKRVMNDAQLKNLQGRNDDDEDDD
jgi:hypothetical protein